LFKVLVQRTSIWCQRGCKNQFFTEVPIRPPPPPPGPPKGTRKPPEIPRKTRIDAGRVPVEARGVHMPKKQAKTAPQVGQKDAKEEPWPHRVAKRVPKRSTISLKMPTFGILVLKV